MPLDAEDVDIMAKAIADGGFYLWYFTCNEYKPSCKCVDCERARKAARAALNVLERF